jgi:hypothetical protein
VQTVLLENLFILFDILIVLRVGMWLFSLALVRFYGFLAMLMLKESTQEEIEDHLRKQKEKNTEALELTYDELHAGAHRMHKVHPPAKMIFEFIAYALWLGSRYIL